MFTPRSLRQPILPGCFVVLLLIVCGYRVYGQSAVETSCLSVAEVVASPSVHFVFQESYGLICLATANCPQTHGGYGFQTFNYRSGVAAWSRHELRDYRQSAL